MRRYPAYKPSGVEWLGEVPEGWEVRPLWSLFRRVKRTGFPEAELLSVYRDYGVVPKASRDDNFNNASEDLSLYQLVKVGDLAINKMKAWQGSVAISEHEGIVSPAYFIFTPMHREDGRYLHYLMRSAKYTFAYLAISKGIRPNQWDLEPQEHSRFPVLLPPLPEQQAIARFLDREVAKLDALVAEQRRLIALLAEKRQAVISHAVTRGLNPTAPLKPSGIDWLGDIPEGWEVVRLRRVIRRIEQGFSPECFSYPASEGEWGVLKTGCVNRGVYNEIKNKALPPEVEPRQEAEVNVGDVLMSRASGSPELIGSVALVEATQGRIMLSDKIFRLRLNGLALPRFLVWAMGSTNMRAQIVNAISGGEGMANNLPQSDIKDFWFALPPHHEQEQIVSYLGAALARSDSLTAAASSAIDLLAERRAALISAAVTGKIDVRDLALQPEPA